MATRHLPGFFSYKTPAVLLFLLWTSTLASGQNKMTFLTDSRYETEWWFPLIKKHSIDPNQFAFGGNLKPGSNEPDGYTALELGGAAFINGKIVTISNATFFIKEAGETYTVITAKTASHDMVDGQIKWENGKIEEYKYKSTDLKPIRSYSFNELQMDASTKKVVIKNAGLIQK